MMIQMSWRYFITFWAIILGAISFYLRINYMPFVEKFGMYQGDLWYFYTYYGQQIAEQSFYFIEYPVGYVIIHKIMYFLTIHLFSDFSYLHFIYIHALIMVPMLAGIFLLVDGLSEKIHQNRKKSWYYLAFSPTLLIASSTNYDLFPVFFTLLSVTLLLKKQFELSLFALAIGTVIKVFPGFLLPLFILYTLNHHTAWPKVISGVLLFIILVLGINLPFYTANPQAWIFPYVWQSSNPQSSDPNTLFYYLNQISFLKFHSFSSIFLLIMFFISWGISWFFYSKQKLTDKNFLYLCLLTCFTAVFANHVNTPQYLLWFIPYISIVQFPLLLLWWPFDLINSTVLYSYFKLSNDYPAAHHIIFTTTIIYFLSFYTMLLLHLKKIFYEKN